MYTYICIYMYIYRGGWHRSAEPGSASSSVRISRSRSAFFCLSLLSSLELRDIKVYTPQIRALVGTATVFCRVFVNELRPVPNGTTRN